MFKDFFPGFIKIHILYHASKKPVYGAWIQEELGRHGYQLSPGTLYPTLHQLEKEGYLEGHSQVVAGRVGHYYDITAKGRQALNESQKKIRELVNEVIEEE